MEVRMASCGECLYSAFHMISIHIIYASTSGHTEYVVEILAPLLRSAGLQVTSTRAELATAEDLLKGDVLILGSGTWNMNGVEGQLNMHMHELLFGQAKDVNLGGKSVGLISLGDDRYFFTTRCTEHFMRFLREHHGKHLSPPLIIVNEPYGQEERIKKWSEKFVTRVTEKSQSNPLSPPSQERAPEVSGPVE